MNKKERKISSERCSVMMRLDKYIADTGLFSRKEVAKACRCGAVTVNGSAVRDPSFKIDENSAVVTVNGEEIKWSKYTYIMLNKPAGYISSTEKSSNTVMVLLPPEFSKMDMFPCGRLDIDTVGLLLITNDGPLAHELLSPRHHAEKTYFFRCFPGIGEAECEKIRAGVDIGGYTTKPAKIEMETPESGCITLTEGKFHQIKRTFEAVGSNITFLQRVYFGGISLDTSLREGEWRYLSEEEIEILRTVK